MCIYRIGFSAIASHTFNRPSPIIAIGLGESVWGAYNEEAYNRAQFWYNVRTVQNPFDNRNMATRYSRKPAEMT